MKGRSLIRLSILCFFLLGIFCPDVGAASTPYFVFSLDKTPASGGDTVRLRVRANSMEDPAAGFRVRVGYDEELLEYTGTETSSRIGNGTLEINPDGNPIYGVYVCAASKGYAPSLSGNIISFVFRVRDGASKGNTELTVCIDQLCNFNAKQLGLTCKGKLPLKIKKGPSSEAALDSLEPLVGTLRPEFSPDVYSYTLRVRHDVDSVEFRADAADGGSVKINRKSLHRAGTETQIVATVTAEDGKTKEYYTVTVRRAPKPASVSSGSRSAPTGAASAGSGNRPYTQAGSELESWRQSAPEPVPGTAGTESRNSAETRSRGPAGTSPVSRPESAEGAQTVTRNLYFVGNRMPEYLVGMLACALCVVTGVALSLWLGIKPKK